MLIKNLFERDIFRPINGVVKAIAQEGRRRVSPLVAAQERPTGRPPVPL